MGETSSKEEPPEDTSTSKPNDVQGTLVELNILHVQGLVPPPGKFFFGKILVRGGQSIVPVLTWQETLTMDLLDDDVVVLGIFAAIDEDHFNKGLCHEYAAIYLPWDIIHQGMKGQEITVNLAMCPDATRLGSQDPVTAYREAYSYSLSTFYQNPSVPHVRMQIVMSGQQMPNARPPTPTAPAQSLLLQERNSTPRSNGVNSARSVSMSDEDYRLLATLTFQNNDLVDALKGTTVDVPDCSGEVEERLRTLKKASRDNWIAESEVAKLSQELEVVSNGLATAKSMKDLPGGQLSDDQRRQKSAAILADLQKAQEENLQIINTYDSQTKALEAKLHAAKTELMEGRLQAQQTQQMGGMPPQMLEQHLTRLQSLQVAYRDACSERDNLAMRYESVITADRESGKKAIGKLQAENEALLLDAQDIRSRMQAKVPPSSQSLSMQRDIGILKQQVEEAELALERDRSEREIASQRMREEASQLQQELKHLAIEKEKVEEELELCKKTKSNVGGQSRERMELTLALESHTKELNRTKHMQQILDEKIKILKQESDQMQQRAQYMSRNAPQNNAAVPPSSAQARLQNQAVELQQKIQALKRVDEELLKERDGAAQMLDFAEAEVNVGRQMLEALTLRFNEATK